MCEAVASPRAEWEKRISTLIQESKTHQSTYLEKIGGFQVYIHPTVYSPRYFPETLWYGTQLPAIVKGRSFLEVGVGSGLISLHLAASGSHVVGVDINNHAVEITQKNFAANQQLGKFLVSDIFDRVDETFDFIFWNHPWQYDSNVCAELKSEKTLDEDYVLLKRFIAEAARYLNRGGSVLLGTSCFADQDAMASIFQANGYSQEVIRVGQKPIGDSVIEEYYIIQLQKETTKL
ncbi:hypothetical protein HIM_00739 [Hirsutella minnesotensis 3608]|nr:hypothetical protein HIM_00739 [Hirsutella minnesotensis 3608]